MGRARDEYHPGVDVSIMNDDVVMMEWDGRGTSTTRVLT